MINKIYFELNDNTLSRDSYFKLRDNMQSSMNRHELIFDVKFDDDDALMIINSIIDDLQNMKFYTREYIDSFMYQYAFVIYERTND